MYDTYQRRIAECDQQLQKHLASFGDTVLPQSPEAEPRKRKAKPTKNAPRFDLGSELKRITGVDLTRIDGIDVMVAQTLLSALPVVEDFDVFGNLVAGLVAGRELAMIDEFIFQ